MTYQYYLVKSNKLKKFIEFREAVKLDDFRFIDKELDEMLRNIPNEVEKDSFNEFQLDFSYSNVKKDDIYNYIAKEIEFTKKYLSGIKQWCEIKKNINSITAATLFGIYFRYCCSAFLHEFWYADMYLSLERDIAVLDEVINLSNILFSENDKYIASDDLLWYRPMSECYDETGFPDINKMGLNTYRVTDYFISKINADIEKLNSLENYQHYKKVVELLKKKRLALFIIRIE